MRVRDGALRTLLFMEAYRESGWVLLPGWLVVVVLFCSIVLL